ncbi:MspA family porin [Nocardia alni]|uniref:MspA family porin n=1 Tax=Nocardia alni TaxID=2815723 RepID=UPI0020B3AFE4
MTFLHAAQVSGDYSVTVTGGPISSGQAVAGFLLGCGVSVAGGVTAGINPNQELNAGVSPTVTLNTPPGVSVSPSVGGSLGTSESLATTLEPGQVTTATTAVAALTDKTQYPFQLTVGNAALNIAQCASPVGAVPFVTTTVSTPHGMVQTTAYGDQFTF